MATQADVWRTIGTATMVLNSELKKEIIRQKAVDTGRMRNVSRVVKLKWDDSTDEMSLKISSTEYYKYVNERKAKKWKGGRIPRDITKAFMKREKVINQLEKVVAKIFECRIDQQFN